VKKKKWLLIVVGLLLLINLAFYAVTRIVDIDDYIESKLSQYLEKYLDAEIEVGNFTFNDRQITISDLQIKARENNFSFEANQIFIKYNLLKLLFTRIGIQQAIKLIDVYEPKFVYNWQQKSDSEEKNQREAVFELPNLGKYFTKLELHDGIAQVNYTSENLSLSKSLGNINLTIDNRKNSRIDFQNKNNNEKIELEAEINNQNLTKMNLQIENFKFDKLQTTWVEKADFKLDAELLFTKQIFNFTGKLQDFYLKQAGIPFSAQAINFRGDKQTITGEIEQAQLQTNPVSGSFTINSLLDDPHIDANFMGNVDLASFFPELQGEINTELQAIGKLVDPHIYLQSNSREIVYQKQKVNAVEFKAEFFQDRADINLNSAIWQGNEFTGNGTYKLKKGLNFNLECDSLQYAIASGKLQGNFFASLEYKNQPRITFALENSTLKWQDYQLSKVNVSGSFQDNKIWLNMARQRRDIVLNGQADLQKKQLSLNLGVKRFNPNLMVGKVDWPVVSGNVNIAADSSQIKLNSSVNLTDQGFGSFDGNILLTMQHEFDKDSTKIELKTNRLSYNYEPLDVEITIQGNSDSLHTQRFSINNEIGVDAYFKRNDSLQYYVQVAAEKIDITDYLRYFMKSYQLRDFSGTSDFQLTVSNQDTTRVTGTIAAKNLSYSNIAPLEFLCKFNGDFNQVDFEKFQLQQPQKEPLQLQAHLKFSPLQYQISGDFQQLKIQDYWKEGNMKGAFNGRFNLQKTTDNDCLSVQLSSIDFQVGSTKLDSLYLDVVQQDSLLVINNLLAKNKKEIDFRAAGSVGYNFLRSTIYPDSSKLVLEYKGDLLRFLSKQIKLISYGKSKADFRFVFSTNEDGILLEDGFLKLEDGNMRIQNQIEQLEHVQIDLLFNENEMQIKKWQLFMGSGWLYISNQIAAERNFEIANINLGQLLLKTSPEGVLVHIPDYMPNNSVANVVVKGRNSAEFIVKGPFYDIQLQGDIYFSNGRAIYPPNSENLLKMFTQVTDIKWPSRKPQPKAKEADEAKELPFELDLMMHFTDNVRYVTYPLDLKVNPESYLHLLYEDGKFQVPEAHFISEQGSVDILGTTMEADFAQVLISPYQKGVKISGSFYKKVADGTMITLDVFNESSDGVYSINKLQYEFSSDNTNDKTLTSILARLRYGRGIDELSDTQRRVLLQDEVVQIAGLGVSNAIIDPLISPIENKIRQWLRLDYFYLQTDVIQNIFQRYSSPNVSEEAYVVEAKPSSITRSGYEMFMDNFSVGLGKYISDDIFLDYQAQFQKPEGLAVTSKMGIYHHFTLRYDLPYKFKLAYKYNILPFDDENTHEIQLQRSFRFW
jgi:hypothetical protein